MLRRKQGRVVNDYCDSWYKSRQFLIWERRKENFYDERLAYKFSLSDRVTSLLSTRPMAIIAMVVEYE